MPSMPFPKLKALPNPETRCRESMLRLITTYVVIKDAMNLKNAHKPSLVMTFSGFIMSKKYSLKKSAMFLQATYMTPIGNKIAKCLNSAA